MKRLCTFLLALASVANSYAGIWIDSLSYLLNTNTHQATVARSGVSTYRQYTEINIPTSVTYNNSTYVVVEIETSSFAGCSLLEKVTIPQSVRSIGKYAFNEDSLLVQINIPSGLKEIKTATFYGCTRLPSLVLPNGLDSIDEYAFYNCSSLRDVNIPSTVKKIGLRAFYGCSSLTSLDVPSGVSAIMTSTFENCHALKTLTLPDNVSSIGELAFSRCYALDSLTLPADLMYIGSWAFYLCENLSSIVIPDNTFAIDQFAFHECYRLKSVKLGKNLTALPERVFSDCWALESIDIPDNITSLGEGAFESCGKLRSVRFSSALTEIPENAFYYCRSLDSVYLPSGVTSIGKWAFAYCDSLHMVTIPQSVTSVHTEAFKNSNALHNVNLNAPQLFNVEGGLSSSFGKQVKRYVLGDAFTTINDDAFAGCDSLQEVEFGPNVTSIGKRAFANLPNLRTITLPDVITTIDEGTFANSNLESITIGPNITSIAADAFSGCTNLKTVTINSTAIFNQTFSATHSLKDVFGPQVTTFILGDSITTIGGYTFAGCESLTNIVFGSNVKKIEHYGLKNCGIHSIAIPEQLEQIGSYVFEGCTNLRTVYWNAINCHKKNSEYMFARILEQIDTIYLGDQVEYIPEYMYAGLTQFSAFTLPANIKGIRDNAFKDCAFTKVYISDLAVWCQLELGHNPLDIANELYLNGQLVEGELTLPGNITTVASRVFDGYQHITSLIIPDNITTIGGYAFRGTPLRAVTVGSGVVDMNYACYQCDSLTTVYLNAPSFKTSCSYAFGPQVTDYILSENITVIGAGWFRDCTNMRAITIPENVTAIETSAFSGCAGLKEIVVPDRVTSIGSYAFSDCHLNKITLGESIDSIADCAFIDSQLDTVVWNIRNYRDCAKDDTPFGQKVMRPVIGPINWSCTSGIKSFIFGDKVEYVPAYLCQNMYNLTSLVFPKGVTSIGENAFYGCNAVTFIDLPSTLTSIGAGTFGSCGQLDTLYCHAKTPPVITDNTFNNYTTYNCKVFVQKSSLAQYKSATGWKNFTNYITIPDEDQGIEEVIANGKLADKQKVLIDGQLYILRGEKIYTMQGQEVK